MFCMRDQATPLETSSMGIPAGGKATATGMLAPKAVAVWALGKECFLALRLGPWKPGLRWLAGRARPVETRSTFAKLPVSSVPRTAAMVIRRKKGERRMKAKKPSVTKMIILKPAKSPQ